MKRLILILATASVLLSCSDVEPGPALTAYENDVIEYFQEVALGFEFGTASQVTRKWKTEVKIFVGGSPNTSLSNELQAIISEINNLATDGFKISITPDSLASNCYLLFGSGAQFAAIHKPAAATVATNYGLFYVFFDNQNYMYRSLIYVDIYRADANAQKHLLREELTQSLGLARDSPRYIDSIFQSSWTFTTSYSEIDKDVIRLLYHPDMLTGLNKEASHHVLVGIVKELGDLASSDLLREYVQSLPERMRLIS